MVTLTFIGFKIENLKDFLDNDNYYQQILDTLNLPTTNRLLDEDYDEKILTAFPYILIEENSECLFDGKYVLLNSKQNSFMDMGDDELIEACKRSNFFITKREWVMDNSNKLNLPINLEITNFSHFTFPLWKDKRNFHNNFKVFTFELE